jgi:hypothetical protein
MAKATHSKSLPLAEPVISEKELEVGDGTDRQGRRGHGCWEHQLRGADVRRARGNGEQCLCAVSAGEPLEHWSDPIQTDLLGAMYGARFAIRCDAPSRRWGHY